jgi:hypothetical protein
VSGTTRPSHSCRAGMARNFLCREICAFDRAITRPIIARPSPSCTIYPSSKARAPAASYLATMVLLHLLLSNIASVDVYGNHHLKRTVSRRWTEHRIDWATIRPITDFHLQIDGAVFAHLNRRESLHARGRRQQ